LVTLVILLICGAICAIIAAHKGRNAVGWFFIGLLFGLLGVIVACVVSNLKEERARYARANADRRRLREELRMERMQRSQAIGQVNRRIDVHDRAIGIDTERAGKPPALPGAAPQQIRAPRPANEKPVWFYAPPGGDRTGPVPLSQIVNEVKMGRLRLDALVWKQGWEDWRAAGDVPEISRAMGN
jgi:hypothetical protein